MGSPPSRRNYRAEYDQFHAKPKQKKNRAARNKARRAANRKGVGKGQDIGHVKALARGGSRSLSNTKVQSRTQNRSSGAKLSRGTKGKSLRRGRKR